MVASTLTDGLIAGGKSLVSALDGSSESVNAAFWFLFPEQHFWKLMISFADMDKEGPKAAYLKIQKALSKMTERDGLSLDDVALLRSDAPLLKLMKVAMRTGPGLSGIRFTNNVVNGQLIPDAYIYRLQ